MTILKQLNELAVAQENGATLVTYGSMTCEWHPIGKLDELDLDLLGDIRIKQPEIDRDDVEWCGYGVPTKDNCDWYMSINKYPLEITKAAAIGMDWNNGYRHLYRYKPQKVTEDDMYICDHADECNAMCRHGGPHEWEESCDELCVCANGKGSHHCIPYVEPQVVPYTLDTFEIKSSHLFCISSKCYVPIGKNTSKGIYIDVDFYTYKDALSALWQWPDGSPFGVEVSDE